MSWIVHRIRESPFATTEWVDWVDIALLSVVIYRVLVVMQGTRALQSLLGIGLLGLLYVVSDVSGLSTVHWVLDGLFVYIVLALIILFQEDVRRALARAGGTLFARATSGPSDAHVLEEVIQAVFALAHRKIGALVVFERQSGSLGPFGEGSHAVDAVVSKELLQAIFHPSSPIHDGAAVISKGRVVSAGVFLPISLSREITRSWGTRHRAAIGLTEATDAVCLVVSEERGTVGVAYRGEVTPVADANDLRQLLMERLGTTHAPAPVKREELVGA